MERKITITEKTDKKVKEVSAELRCVGLDDYSDCYFEDDDYNGPFFKIEKAYKRESDGDPETECIFLDVTDEYTVHTRLGHEHYNDCKKAVEIVKGLYDGKIAEVSLCFPTLTARFLIDNTGNPEKNIAKINDNANNLMEIVNGVYPTMANGKSQRHLHIIFPAACPHYLQIIPEKNDMHGGYPAYLQSVVIGEPAEIYIVQ